VLAGLSLHTATPPLAPASSLRKAQQGARRASFESATRPTSIVGFGEPEAAAARESTRAPASGASVASSVGLLQKELSGSRTSLRVADFTVPAVPTLVRPASRNLSELNLPASV